MTRAIKFRAWTEDYGMMQVSKMVECDDGVMHYFTKASDSGYYDLDNPKNALLQFTGPHDKNGVEIYEGDIVTIPVLQHSSAMGNVYKDAICEVGFHCGTFTVNHKDEHGMIWTMSLCSEGPDRMCVIGNIYENPELMEA